MKMIKNKNIIRSVIICTLSILYIVALTGCEAKDEPASDNAYDTLEKYAISQADEKGVVSYFK